MSRANVLWMAVIVASAFMLYMVKYQVQSVKAQAAQTAHELEAEKEALHVAAAEWAYLNRPERLRRLAARYLGDTDMTVQQVAAIREIPFPERQEAANEVEDVRPAALRMRGAR